MSSRRRAPAKLKLNEPSIGLTVTVGWIRSPRNGASAASRARSSTEATFSKIERARRSASFSLLGAVIRSTSATRTPAAVSSWTARQTSDDFP